MELCRRQQFGHLVRNLCIKMKDHDSQLIIALPTIFPRIKYLDWRDMQFRASDEQEAPPAIQFDISIFSAVVQKWKDIEGIKDYSNIGLTQH